MENLLNKLERKFGRYAIPNLTFIMIGLYVVGYLLQAVNSSAAAYMCLNPQKIFSGEVWRVFTWIVIPPSSLSSDALSLFFTVIMLFFYLSIGNSLEKAWGRFRYNIYIFGGMLVTLIVALVSYGVCCAFYGDANARIAIGAFIGASYSTYYILMSMFLAYAATFPDAVVLIYFVLPVKVKWLGVAYFAFMLYDMWGYFRSVFSGNMLAILPILAMAASILNFLLFFFTTRSARVKRYAEARQRRAAYEKAMAAGQKRFSENAQRVRRQEAKQPRHRCAVCGRTELSDPDLEFRFCTKCAGEKEYCMDHLYTHIHAVKAAGKDEE